MILPLLALSALIAATETPPSAATPALPPERAAAPGLAAVSPAALSAATRFLGSGLLDGRETATRGHEIAALWVSTQMQAIGLAPGAADGSWQQEVPLRAWKVDAAASSLAVHGPALPPQQLAPDVDFVALGDGEHAEVELDGALAFAGYGITAPEYGYDDLRGVNLAGKVAIVLSGAPSSDRPNFFPPGPRAAYADRAGKMRRLAARGAVGVLFVHTPEAERTVPWADLVRASRLEGMGWAVGVRLGDGVDKLPARAVLSMRGLERLAAAAGVAGGARGILDKADANRLSAQDWPVKVRMRSSSELRPTRSPNVLGLLRGSDPARARETVVVLAHLDHRGAGAPAGGDPVHGRAGDDAVGVAVLLEVARAFAALPRPPARSVLFAVVTGAEQGLVGSSFLATHPVVDPTGIVAVVDVGGSPADFPFQDVVAHGAGNSTLAGPVQRAAAALQLPLSADAGPGAAAIVRSDPWNFVRTGVPALAIAPGGRGTEEAARLARFQFLVTLLVAEGPDRPAWNPDDAFGRLVRPP